MESTIIKRKNYSKLFCVIKVSHIFCGYTNKIFTLYKILFLLKTALFPRFTQSHTQMRREAQTHLNWHCSCPFIARKSQQKGKPKGKAMRHREKSKMKARLFLYLAN